MRYWFKGEDESYERELERLDRFSGSWPAPISPLDETIIVLLVGIHATALTAAALAFVLWM
jgi:hypothetical protein